MTRLCYQKDRGCKSVYGFAHLKEHLTDLPIPRNVTDIHCNIKITTILAVIPTLQAVRQMNGILLVIDQVLMHQQSPTRRIDLHWMLKGLTTSDEWSTTKYKVGLFTVKRPALIYKPDRQFHMARILLTCRFRIFGRVLNHACTSHILVSELSVYYN